MKVHRHLPRNHQLRHHTHHHFLQSHRIRLRTHPDPHRSPHHHTRLHPRQALYHHHQIRHTLPPVLHHLFCHFPHSQTHLLRLPGLQSHHYHHSHRSRTHHLFRAVHQFRDHLPDHTHHQKLPAHHTYPGLQIHQYPAQSCVLFWLCDFFSKIPSLQRTLHPDHPL